MKRQHQRTLEALFSHPLVHGLRASKVEALLHALGADVTSLEGRRLRIQMPGGQESWLEVAEPASPRGDQSRRLVIHLDHHRTDVFLLEGDEVEHAVLVPHGVWGSGENLSHRHDRDIAGQKAPRDHDYLTRVMAAMEGADAVLLLGHGTGESDMRQLLLAHVRRHRPDLLERLVGVETLAIADPSEGQVLAVAREHFGNLPHRRPLVIPGQEVVEA